MEKQSISFSGRLILRLTMYKLCNMIHRRGEGGGALGTGGQNISHVLLVEKQSICFLVRLTSRLRLYKAYFTVIIILKRLYHSWMILKIIKNIVS